MRFKKMKEKRKIKILTAKALAKQVEGNIICIQCNESFKPKKKHATDKTRRNKKQRGNMAFFLPPGNLAIVKKRVYSKTLAKQPALHAKNSSASVSEDFPDDSGSDTRDLLHKDSSDESSAGDDSKEDDSEEVESSTSVYRERDSRDVHSLIHVPLHSSFEAAGSKSAKDASARLQAQTVRMGKRYVESAIETETGFGASSLDEVQAFNVYCASSSAGMGTSSRLSRDSGRLKEGSLPSFASAPGAKFSTVHKMHTGSHLFAHALFKLDTSFHISALRNMPCCGCPHMLLLLQ